MERAHLSRQQTAKKRSYADDSDPDDVADNGQGTQTSKPATKRYAKASQAVPIAETSENEEQPAEEEDPESSISESGQIAEIYMENFMCHKKFTIKFGNHLNFIGGANGSGIFHSFQLFCISDCTDFMLCIRSVELHN
jgi:hypothetical protein